MNENMIFTAAELSWLLSGRTSESARHARTVLQLENLKEGDPRILDGAQSLVARGLATVEGEDVSPTDITALFAYALGAANYWTQLVVNGEGFPAEALFTVTAEDLDVFFLLRLRPLGVVEVMVSMPGTHPSQGFGNLIDVYSRAEGDTGISLIRGFGDEPPHLVAERTGSDWQVLRRQAVTGRPDVALGESITVSTTALLRDVQHLLR